MCYSTHIIMKSIFYLIANSLTVNSGLPDFQQYLDELTSNFLMALSLFFMVVVAAVLFYSAIMGFVFLISQINHFSNKDKQQLIKSNL